MTTGFRSLCFLIIISSLGFGLGSCSTADDSMGAGLKAGGPVSYQAAEYSQNYFINTVGMEFKLLRPGTFIMGSVDGDEDEVPVHLVTISRPFYMGTYEVTQNQWKQIMGENPSEFKDDRRPVENVSWNEVQEFIKKLSEKEGVSYRLPTEAEWEYACRAGTKTTYYWGDEFNGQYAWCLENSGGKTQPVGLKKTNAWGLYDMSGNVYEWCADGYSEYPDGHFVDPQVPSGSRRIGRGGGWNSSVKGCRSSNRGSIHPYRRFDLLGFRLVRD